MRMRIMELSAISRVTRLTYVTTCLTLTLGCPLFSKGGSDVTWNELGGVQVLEKTDCLYVFVQVDKVVDHTSLLSRLMSTHPTKRIVSQSLIILDGAGSMREVPIVFMDAEKRSSISIAVSTSRIFVHKNHMFNIDFNQSPARPTLYRWQEDRFLPVRQGDEGDLTKTMAFIQHDAKLVADQEGALDDLTKNSGWRYIPEDFPEEQAADQAISYVSRLHNVKIKLATDDRKNTLPRVNAVVAESLSLQKPWTKTLIKIDVDEKREKRGAGKDMKRKGPAG